MTKTPKPTRVAKPVRVTNPKLQVQLARAKANWIEHPDILVFEQTTTEWYQSSNNQKLSSVAQQGGLHPARKDWTYMIWSMCMLSLNAYYVKVLSMTPHYAIRWSDWPA